ncbi:MAG TPA: hypothetical protein VFO49_07680 [Nocardioides sp.]|nr:hypothetical protein [Nocardioides sp.]
MTDIYDLAGRNGATLRDEVAATVDLEASLSDLLGRHNRRHRKQLVAGLTAAAAAVAVVAAVAVTRDPGMTEPLPAPSPTTPAPSHDFACTEGPSVQCLPGGRVRVDAARPFTLVPPTGFASEVSVGRAGTELYRDDTELGSGVAFIDDALPARRNKHLDAEEFARWIAASPYLDADTPQRTTVAGRPAWQVRVSAPGAPGDQRFACNQAGSPCWPVTATPRGRELPPWETGPWKGMANRYTFIDLPGGATFGIWSWAFGANWAAIDANEELIGTLRIQTP